MRNSVSPFRLLHPPLLLLYRHRAPHVLLSSFRRWCLLFNLNSGRCCCFFLPLGLLPLPVYRCPPSLGCPLVVPLSPYAFVHLYKWCLVCVINQIISLLRQEDSSGDFSTFHVRRWAGRGVDGGARILIPTKGERGILISTRYQVS